MASLVGESEEAAHARYSPAKATKRGGKDVQESEHLVVPPKRGKRPHRDPVEGRRCRSLEP